MTTLEVNTLDLSSPARPLCERFVAAHRFLLQHAFYPLMLCTLLGVAFLITRAYILGHLEYRFLVWNLFLAWVPYGCSLLAIHLHKSPPHGQSRGRSRHHFLKAIVWLVWLAMFPNAPYIITDFVHLREIAPLTWWFDLGMVLTFALAGCFLGIVSLRIMHDLVRPRIGRAGGWLFVTAVAILSGFGVYLGRFQRFNSWDIIARPRGVFGQIITGLIDPLSHGRTWGVTLMFGAMMLVTYIMFVSTSQSDRKLQQNNE